MTDNLSHAHGMRQQSMLLAIISSLAAIIQGCTIATASKSSALPEDFPTGSPLPAVQQVLNAQARHKQLQVRLIIDDTGSFAAHHTAPVQESDVRHLIDFIIAAGGGKVIIDLVCPKGDGIPLSLRIAPPPKISPSYFHNPLQPTPPDEPSLNSFDLPRAKQHYQQQKADYSLLVAADEERLEEYQTAFRESKEEAETKATAFLQELAPLLTEPATCQTSDVWGALRRAEVAATEESGKTQFEQVIIAVTDGIDSSGATLSLKLPDEVTTILVNGSGEKGIFADLPHKHSTSFENALEVISNFN